MFWQKLNDVWLSQHMYEENPCFNGKNFAGCFWHRNYFSAETLFVEFYCSTINQHLLVLIWLPLAGFRIRGSCTKSIPSKSRKHRESPWCCCWCSWIGKGFIQSSTLLSLLCANNWAGKVFVQLVLQIDTKDRKQANNNKINIISLQGVNPVILLYWMTLDWVVTSEQTSVILLHSDAIRRGGISNYIE